MKLLVTCLLLAGLLASGCKKRSAPAPVPPAAAPTGTGDAAAAQEVPDLAALNVAYKKFWKEQSSPPAKLEDLVAKNYLRSLPVPPPGKKFNVDWKKMEVTLVDQ